MQINTNSNPPEDANLDKLVDELFEPNKVGAILKEAELQRKRLATEQWHLMRVAAKRNLFFFSTTVLGYDRLSPVLHGDLCTQIRATEPHWQYRGWLLPRAHFKSTIITIAHNLQTVLPYTEEDAKYDDSSVGLTTVERLGTDARILIAHEVRDQAARFLFSITNHVTSNPTLLALFPELQVSNRKQRVNKYELELPRTKGWTEPTIDTLGVGSRSQGNHYDVLSLDDIFGDKARDSESEANATKDWLDELWGFYVKLADGRLKVAGTRYANDDAYAHLMERYGSQMLWYTRKIEEFNQETGKKEPIFPEEITQDKLTILKKNKKVFAAQYLNDPSDNQTGFQENFLKRFYWKSQTEIIVFDGTEDHPVQRTTHIRDLDVVFLIDPGVSRTGGFVVTGIDHKWRIYILQSIALEHKPDEFGKLFFTMCARWQPRVAAIESDLFAAVFEAWFKTEMATRKLRTEIVPVFTKQKQKDTRIAGLIPFGDYGIYCTEQQEELIRQVKQWGKTKQTHIIDALAYGPEVWMPGRDPLKRPKVFHTTQAAQGGRDPVTGYSSI